MMSDERKKVDSDEKNRICPSCRMSISVLATKCRFCGEEVGRPKEAARHMTISDLGGETVHHRAPSGSVLDAMESFRMEEQQGLGAAAQEDDADAVIGRRRQSESTDVSLAGGFDDLPTLDEGHSDIASLSLNRSGSSLARKAKPTTVKDRILTVLKIGVPAAIVLVVLVKGYGWTRNYVDQKNEPQRPDYVNQAPQILRTGGPPIRALSAAVDALGYEETNENLKILEQSVQAVVDEVNRHLNASPWSLDELDEASKISSAAATIYPSDVTNRLDAEVKQENAAYKMNLTSVDPFKSTATFALNTTSREPVTVKKGEVIADRFSLRSILGRDKVKVEDKLRDNRVIIFEIGGLPHQ